MSAEHLHATRQARGLLPTPMVLILCMVIVVAGGYSCRTQRRTAIPPGPSPRIKWTKSFGVEQGFSTSPMLGNDGSLYVASVRGNVYSLDPSGAVRWQYRSADFIAGGLLQDQGENIYFATLTEVYSLTPSGRKRWETACSPAKMWQDDQGGTFDGDLLYTSCGKTFCALNKEDGAQKWTRPALVSEAAPVLLPDGTLVFVSDRQVIATDRDGKTLWTFPRDSASTYDPRVASFSPPETWEFWLDTPIAVGADQTLYLGSAGNFRFLALDAHGKPKWTFVVESMDQSFYTSPVVAVDGTIYALTARGLLYAFAPDGTLKWKFQLPKPTNGGLHAAPVLGSDGTIYLLAEQKLIALSPEGSMTWELALPGSFGGSPALAPDGTLYVATFEGAIYAVQTASQGLMQSAWPKYQHDSSNSGRALGVSNK